MDVQGARGRETTQGPWTPNVLVLKRTRKRSIVLNTAQYIINSPTSRSSMIREPMDIRHDQRYCRIEVGARGGNASRAKPGVFGSPAFWSLVVW